MRSICLNDFVSNLNDDLVHLSIIVIISRSRHHAEYSQGTWFRFSQSAWIVSAPIFYREPFGWKKIKTHVWVTKLDSDLSHVNKHEKFKRHRRRPMVGLSFLLDASDDFTLKQRQQQQKKLHLFSSLCLVSRCKEGLKYRRASTFFQPNLIICISLIDVYGCLHFGLIHFQLLPLYQSF